MDLELQDGECPLATEKALRYCHPVVSLEDIHPYILRCESCPARKGVTLPTIPGGPLDAELVVIGRSPQCFQGDLLDQILSMMGTSREDVYLTSSLFCHPKGRRVPVSTEIRTCSPWKVWEFARLKRARFFLLLGIDPAWQFLGAKPPAEAWFRYAYRTPFHGRTVYALPGYRLGYVLQKDQELGRPLAEWCRATGEFMTEIRKQER